MWNEAGEWGKDRWRRVHCRNYPCEQTQTKPTGFCVTCDKEFQKHKQAEFRERLRDEGKYKDWLEQRRKYPSYHSKTYGKQYYHRTKNNPEVKARRIATRRRYRIKSKGSPAHERRLAYCREYMRKRYENGKSK